MTVHKDAPDKNYNLTAYNEKRGLAVVLILTTLHIGSRTKYGNLVIDGHGQEIQELQGTVG